MVWCHQATGHDLSQCRSRSMSPYGVTCLQYININMIKQDKSVCNLFSCMIYQFAKFTNIIYIYSIYSGFCNYISGVSYTIPITQSVNNILQHWLRAGQIDWACRTVEHIYRCNVSTQIWHVDQNIRYLKWMPLAQPKNRTCRMVDIMELHYQNRKCQDYVYEKWEYWSTM